jgi:integrase
MRFTPRGLRRTFNDLARAARVEALVTRSISGHQTERMREHYSTVQPVEQRQSIGAVLRLLRRWAAWRWGGSTLAPSGGSDRDDPIARAPSMG